MLLCKPLKKPRRSSAEAAALVGLGSFLPYFSTLFLYVFVLHKTPFYKGILTKKRVLSITTMCFRAFRLEKWPWQKDYKKDINPLKDI